MRQTTLGALAMAALILGAPPLQAQNYTWYRFSKAFIAAAYPDGIAAADLGASNWKAAGNVHSTSCGGNDGELHIGVFDTGIDLPDAQKPPSAPLDDDNQWGLVAELPDAKNGDGPAHLDQVKDQAVTFTGYFRVWDEGHGAGTVYPSNPHHILELHPAWAFASSGTTFSSPGLIHAMEGYRRYGATKFKPVLAAIQQGDFPTA